MSRETTPPPLPMALAPPRDARACCEPAGLCEALELQLPGGAVVVLVQLHADRYIAGVALGCAITCRGCWCPFEAEAEWRAHTHAPPSRLLMVSPEGTVVPAKALVPIVERTYCCDRVGSLACACASRTGWVMLGSAADALHRLLGGTPPASLAATSPASAAVAIRRCPTTAAASLGVESIGWIAAALEGLSAATPVAILPYSTLAYCPRADVRLQLWPAELELAAGLLVSAGARCPIVCRCGGGVCLAGVRRAMSRRCRTVDHPVVCYACR